MFPVHLPVSGEMFPLVTDFDQAAALLPINFSVLVACRAAVLIDFNRGICRPSPGRLCRWALEARTAPADDAAAGT
jgi:hypothetical protein